MFVQTNSVRSIKEYMNSRLKGQFTESEIKQIANESICERLKITRSDLLMVNDQLLSESDLLYFRSVVKRLLQNEPLQYIIGSTEFYGLQLRTDKRALIPRPETEELVEWIKASFRNKKELKIVDLCTGSGCIALACKSVFSDAQLKAVDYSMEALSLAKENADLLKLEVDFYHFDVLSNDLYPEAFFESDIWVSNPPYVLESDKKEMTDTVLEYEPHMALFVKDEDPLIFYRAIAEKAMEMLKNGGVLFFEIHENQGENLLEMLISSGWKNVEIKQDLQGKDRMMKAEKP